MRDYITFPLKQLRRFPLVFSLVLFPTDGALGQDVKTRLNDDERLRVPISISRTGCHLSELLATLSPQIIKLTADAHCGQTRIQIQVDRKPLYAVLEALAELVPGNWARLPNNEGYRLLMNKAAVETRKDWWSLIARERKRVFDAQRAYTLLVLRSQPEFRAPDPAEASDPKADAERILTHTWYYSLPDRLKMDLAARMPEIAFMRSEGPFFANPYPREGAVAVPIRELSADLQSALRRRNPMINDSATLYLSNSGFSLKPMVIFPDGTRTGLDISFTVGPAPMSEMVGLDHRALSRMIELYKKSAPAAWHELLKYQQGVVWKNDPPPNVLRRFPPPRRSDALARLMIQGGIDLIADYYSRPGFQLRPAEKARVIRGSLKSELDELAAEHDLSWRERSDKILLIRNNRWYRDDELEVDRRIAARLLNSRPRFIGKSALESETFLYSASAQRQLLDWKAEIARSVSPMQLANGLMHYYTEDGDPRSTDYVVEKPKDAPFRAISEQILSEYRSVLFYGSLSKNGRSLALEGRLPVRSLTAAQLREAAWLAPELQIAEPKFSRIKIGFERPLGFLFLGDAPTTANIPIIQLVVSASQIQ